VINILFLLTNTKKTLTKKKFSIMQATAHLEFLSALEHEKANEVAILTGTKYFKYDIILHGVW